MNSKLLIGGLALFLLLPNLGCEKSAKQALPTSQREAKRGHLSSLENFSESELSAFTATYDPADPKSKEKAIGTLDKAVKLFVSPKINTKLSESAQCVIDSDDTTGRAWVSSLSISRPREIPFYEQFMLIYNAHPSPNGQEGMWNLFTKEGEISILY